MVELARQAVLAGVRLGGSGGGLPVALAGPRPVDGVAQVCHGRTVLQGVDPKQPDSAQAGPGRQCVWPTCGNQTDPGGTPAAVGHGE